MRTYFRVLVLVLLVGLAVDVSRGEDDSPFPIKDYSGGIKERINLLGEWGGLRNDLAENGIVFEIGLTNVHQNNLRGGRYWKHSEGYTGSADAWLLIDTQRLGLWDGGLWTFHGETLFGNSPIVDVGSVMPVNYDATVPEYLDFGLTTLSELYLTQFFNRDVLVIAGKVDPLVFADKNAFAADERRQFLNTAFRANPVLFNLAPYTSLAANVTFFPADWVTVSFFGIDTNSEGARRTGFDTAFQSPQGTTVGTEFDFMVEPCGLEGHQRIGFGYSNKEFPIIDNDPRIDLPAGGLGPDTKGDDYAIYYNFDQYLFVEDDDPSQGIGLFGRYGYSTGDVNPVQSFYSFGVGGKGLLEDKDDDTFGLGYYYIDMSDAYPRSLNLSSEQGVEAYYDMMVAKSVHFYQGLQWIVDPSAGSESLNNTITLGMRVQIDF